MDSRTLLEKIEWALREPLPGIPAQLAMAPEPRRGHKAYFEVEGSCLKAGVLVLLFERAGQLRLLLTQSADRLLHHRGQISLPGGEQQPGESAEATGLRETEEELGLVLEGATILGRLTPLYIPPSNFCVYPTVVFFAGTPVVRPQPDEVAEVIEFPLQCLADPLSRRRETWTIEGRTVSVPFYEFAGYKIWGATAMILAELAALLEKMLD